MNKKFLLPFLLLAFPNLFAADHQWILKESTLTYHVSHPLHQTDGVSRSARGKGICHEGQCDFLIAVPVKTFDSGDSNRDLHMIQVTRGAEFPMVTVRTAIAGVGLHVGNHPGRSGSPVRRTDRSLPAGRFRGREAGR